jgi:hypothetical protein
MTPLTDRDKRTVRYAAIGLAIYLVVFFSVKLVRRLENERTAYANLVLDARLLKQQWETQQARTELIEKLRKESGVDLSKVPKASLVTKTSEAIQQAAMSGGIKLGPMRETPGNHSRGELAVVQLEATGQVQGMLNLIHQVQALGYPVIIDGLEMKPDPRQPNMLRLDVDLVILDLDKWQPAKRRTDA